MLRLFKLNTGQDDHAVMFFDDYLKQVGLIMYMNVLYVGCQSGQTTVRDLGFV